MKSLSLVAAAVVSFGALALAGCSSCSPQEEAKKAETPVTCGPGTVASGSQCVGTTSTH